MRYRLFKTAIVKQPDAFIDEVPEAPKAGRSSIGQSPMKKWFSTKQVLPRKGSRWEKDVSRIHCWWRGNAPSELTDQIGLHDIGLCPMLLPVALLGLFVFDVYYKLHRIVSTR